MNTFQWNQLFVQLKRKFDDWLQAILYSLAHLFAFSRSRAHTHAHAHARSNIPTWKCARYRHNWTCFNRQAVYSMTIISACIASHLLQHNRISSIEWEREREKMYFFQFLYLPSYLLNSIQMIYFHELCSTDMLLSFENVSLFDDRRQFLHISTRHTKFMRFFIPLSYLNIFNRSYFTQHFGMFHC